MKLLKKLTLAVAACLLVACAGSLLVVQFAPKSAVAQTISGFYDKLGTKGYRTSSGILTIPTAQVKEPEAVIRKLNGWMVGCVRKCWAGVYSSCRRKK